MKFILCGLVFAIALYCTSAQRTREEVLQRAEDLETKAKADVEKLKADGKDLQATEVQREAAVIARLAEELRNAHAVGVLGEARIRAIELELTLAESRLERQLKAVEETTTGAFAKRDLKTDLLAKAAELLTKSGGIVQLLESQGKPLLAEGVKAIETFVKEIETKLENSHPSSEIGKLAVEGLEFLLKEAETKLEEEAKKLGITFVKRDLKTDLLAKAAELLTKSGGIVQLLESQGKPLLAEGVKAIETFVKEIETKLENSHPSSEIGKLAVEGLEFLLKEAETKLEEEAKKLGITFVKRDLKTDLLAKAAELLTKSGGIIETLEKEGKPLLAEGFKVIESFVKEIETKLENSHPSSEIGKLAVEGLEVLLKEAETKLEEEEKKLVGALL